MTLCQDLGRKSLDEIQYGAKRYRTTPGNKWFPTPGAWLEACTSPYSDKPRRYTELPPLPEPLPEGRAKELIEATRQKYDYWEGRPKSADALKAEILARPPLEMTPEMQELEKSLKRERLDTLSRRLQSRHA